MKKRIALMATALLCALAICLSVIPALTIFAEGAEATNVALGKTVTITEGASVEGNPEYGAAMLTDGLYGYDAIHTSPKQRGWLKPDGSSVPESFIISEENPLDIVIDLGGTYAIDSVCIYAITNFNYVFPTYFEILVSETEDGDDWVTVHTAEDVVCGKRLSSSDSRETYDAYPDSDKFYNVEFDATKTARRVCIHITEPSTAAAGNDCYMGFGEIEVYGVAAAAETEPESELENVALNAYVWQNDANNIADNERFALDFLVDGSALTSWHGDYNNGAGATPRAPTILTIEMGSVCEISAINVYSYTGEVYATAAFPEGVPVLPQAFTLEVFSVEENDWVEVGSYELAGDWDIATPDPDELNFEFDPVEATQVRVVITQNGGYAVLANAVTLIGEVEVMGTVVGEVPPAETETQAPAVTETQAPSVTETEAPEETVVETVVESDVESAEESAEESDTTVETVVDETVADTGVEETVADTTAATDAPAADAEEGCASVVGFGAVAVLAAAAAAVVLKKKD